MEKKKETAKPEELSEKELDQVSGGCFGKHRGGPWNGASDDAGVKNKRPACPYWELLHEMATEYLVCPTPELIGTFSGPFDCGSCTRRKS